MNRNKALLIIVIVAVIVILALAIFYFFFMGESVPGEPVTPDDTTFPIGPDISGGTGATSTVPYQYEYYNKPQTFEVERQRLRLISSLPVSGATLLNRNAEIFIRYVERANGHIYEASASKNDAPYRISKTTIPKIYEAYWVNDGQGVIIRYIKDEVIQTFYARIRPSGSTTTEQDLVDGTFLPNDVSALAVSQTGDKIFYLVKNSDGTLGFRSNPNGGQRSQIFSSEASEWLPSWVGDNTVLLTTKPSAFVQGFSYSLNANSGAIRKVMDSVNGLTVLPSSDLSRVLYSQSQNNSLILKSINISNGAENEIGVNTLPEKCVWSEKSAVVFCAVPDFIGGAVYPDAWYQGVISFTDNLWKIDLVTGEATIILTPQIVAQKTMDIVNLGLDSSEKYLLFTNKKDLSLWLFEFKTP